MVPGGKLRVVHLTGQLTTGGLENQLYLLLSSIDRDGFDSSAVSFAEGGRFAARIRELGVPVSCFPRRGLSRVRRLVEHLRRERPDVVYAWGTAAMAYGRIAGTLSRVPVVTHDGSTRRLPTKVRVRAANLSLVPFTAAFVCNTYRRYDELRWWLPVHPSRILVIPNGVRVPEHTADPETAAKLRAELSLPDGPIIGCVARLDGLKNQHALLDAVRQLKDRGIEASLVLVGEGKARRDLEDHAVGLGIAGRVRLVGDQEDVGRFLRGFSVFALPSLLEGMPNALQEALAVALPAVASDVGDVRRVLEDGAAGVVVPPRDVRALADGIERVLGYPTLAARFGERGRERMKKHFSIEAAARRTEEIFRRVVRSPRAPFRPLAASDPGAHPCAC